MFEPYIPLGLVWAQGSWINGGKIIMFYCNAQNSKIPHARLQKRMDTQQFSRVHISPVSYSL
jgi:hypothetical protein